MNKNLLLKYDDVFDDIANDVIEDLTQDEVEVFVATERTIGISLFYDFHLYSGEFFYQIENILCRAWDFIKRLHGISDMSIEHSNTPASREIRFTVSFTNWHDRSIREIVSFIKDMSKISCKEYIDVSSVMTNKKNVMNTEIYMRSSIFVKKLSRILDTFSIYKFYQILGGKDKASEVFRILFGEYLETMAIRDHLAKKNMTPSSYSLPVEQINKVIGFMPNVWISGIIFMSPNRSKYMFDNNKEEMITSGRYHIIDVLKRPYFDQTTKVSSVYVIYNMISSNDGTVMGCPYNKIDIPFEVDMHNNGGEYILSQLNKMVIEKQMKNLNKV